MGYQNFFATRLTTDIGASDNTITLETAPSKTSGRLVLEARNPTTREIISYTGVSGTQITGVARGLGGTSATTHTKNSLVEMNLTAEDIQDLYDAFDAYSETAGDGWLPLVTTLSVATGYNKGNKEFVLDSTADLTSLLSPGMRLKLSRGTTAPTQCLDLESSSSQYASKSSPSGVSTTTTITCEGWVKLESYGIGAIVSQYTTYGWILYVLADGTVRMLGDDNAGTSDTLTTYQSIPLGRWVHIAAAYTVNSGGSIYIDGVSVPTTFSNGTCTSAAGNGSLQVGAYNSAHYFDGKIADVRVWNTVRTATQIRDNMNQQLVGNESGLVAYFKLNGDLNDSTANANNMTGSGGAVATDTDNPFHDTEYAIITKVTSSQLTVFTGTDYQVPNMTLSTPYYSSHKAPYGFPSARGKWFIETIDSNDVSTTSSSYTNSGINIQLAAPIGLWIASVKAHQQHNTTTSNTRRQSTTLAQNSTSTETHPKLTATVGQGGNSSGVVGATTYAASEVEVTTSQTIHYLLVKTTTPTANLAGTSAEPTVVKMECAYL